MVLFFFFQAEDGIRDADVTGVQTCALPISPIRHAGRRAEWALAWHRPQFSSPWGFAARLERRSPRIGRWSRTAVKLTRLIVVRMAAWPVALAARLLARI